MKTSIMTHISIFILAVCTLINYLISTRHMCCDGGEFFSDIVWCIVWIILFAVILIIFDIITLVSNKKGGKKDDR